MAHQDPEKETTTMGSKTKTTEKHGKHSSKSSKKESKKAEKPAPKEETPKAPKEEKAAEEKKPSMRSHLLHLIEKARAHKKNSLGERSKLIEKFQKQFGDREPKAVQDALVRYINDAKVHPLGKYLLTEDEGGIGITKSKSSDK